ncbi:MAG TPA: IPT/TIG domain-containing protein [Solirubrobacterales bacterium]|nr:IPT/TIG domain-containing protein [Solirubrobacterales bacterium]
MGHGSHRNHADVARRRRRAFSLALIPALLALGIAAPPAARAEPIVIGQVAPMSPMAYCGTPEGKPAELLVSSTEGGNAFAAPIAGTITSWSTTAASAPGQQVGLKIYRPVPGNEEKLPEVTLPPGIMDVYTVVGHDGPRLLKPDVLNTFATDIPVRAGDIVGYYSANGSKTTPNACWYNNLVATDYLAINETSTSDGSSVYLPTLARAARTNISAVLQPPPTLASLSPASGPVTGGTTVSITGGNLENATGVTFGGAAATGFRVVSENEIIATTPPGTGSVSVTATVTTIAGSATGAGFTYESPKTAPATKPHAKRKKKKKKSRSCVVPDLRGKKLRAVRQKLRRSHCRLGKVTGSRRKTAVVKRQHPATGKVSAAGASVDVVLGPRRRR